MNKFKAFTLAEVLIVLSILGIIASMTIPTVIKNQKAMTERTKLKRAWKVYDYIVQKMVTENGIKSVASLKNFAESNNCENTRLNFKTVEVDSANGCIFRTSDGVWWNVSDIMHPIIALGNNKSLLYDVNNLSTFTLVTLFDGITGAFRTNDIAYIETYGTEEELASIIKISDFIENRKNLSNKTNSDSDEDDTPYYEFGSNDYVNDIILKTFGYNTSEHTEDEVQVDSNGRIKSIQKLENCSDEYGCESSGIFRISFDDDTKEITLWDDRQMLGGATERFVYNEKGKKVSEITSWLDYSTGGKPKGCTKTTLFNPDGSKKETTTVCE